MISRSINTPIFKKLNKLYELIYSYVAYNQPDNIIVHLPSIENNEKIEGEAEIEGTQRYGVIRRYLIHRQYLKKLIKKGINPIRQRGLFE